jgi:hypothetical protein
VYPTSRGGDLRRFDTTPHPCYCGIDRQARSRYVCLLNQDGDLVVHRHLPTTPEALRKTMAPDREQMVSAVDWLVTWDLAG